MKIIGISGSLRKASYITALLRKLVALQPQGMEIEPIRLIGVPVYDGDDEKASGKPATILELDQKIRAADGIIIVTPEYNFSIPGGLKNAIDWLSRGKSPLKGKRVASWGPPTAPSARPGPSITCARPFNPRNPWSCRARKSLWATPARNSTPKATSPTMIQPSA